MYYVWHLYTRDTLYDHHPHLYAIDHAESVSHNPPKTPSRHTPSSSCDCKCAWILRTSRNVYVSNTTHTTQPNVRNILRALHQVSATNVRFRLRVICRRSFIGVGGARDDEHESESEEHVISLRFRLTPTTVHPVSASSSFRFRIFLQPPPPTADENRLLTSLLIGRGHDDDASVSVS